MEDIFTNGKEICKEITNFGKYISSESPSRDEFNESLCNTNYFVLIFVLYKGSLNSSFNGLSDDIYFPNLVISLQISFPFVKISSISFFIMFLFIVHPFLLYKT